MQPLLKYILPVCSTSMFYQYVLPVCATSVFYQYVLPYVLPLPVCSTSVFYHYVLLPACTTSMYYQYVLPVCTISVYYQYVLPVFTASMYYQCVLPVCTTSMYQVCTISMYYQHILRAVLTHLRTSRENWRQTSADTATATTAVCVIHNSVPVINARSRTARDQQHPTRMAGRWRCSKQLVLNTIHKVTNHCVGRWRG